ncbi:MAG: gamma-glutamyl-gamma-aminobutyrate hydrolase family protein [Proteobacteria bacterium]|nr:gamma-glutamyl-gamma-aminobutyrate hydrolase family protein [Pseudomonadota bacterium]
MQKVLVIKQVLVEGPGIIGMELLRLGLDMVVIEPYAGDSIPESLDGYGALILLGGPMSVYDESEFPYLTKELKLLALALKESVPVLGVCLGAQLLARAAGAKVYPGPVKEIGYYSVSVTDEGRDDTLMAGLSGELNVFQWHGDTFDLPEGATRIASSLAYKNQMFRVGSVAYGTQFHLEVTAEMVATWVESQRGEVESAGLDAEEILSASKGQLPFIHKNGAVIIKRFLELVGQ